ncbi:hypothetical protein DV736_g6622, partial [Chaetothyriales sp. CBS 134916]
MGGNPGAMQLQGTNTYLVGTGRRRIIIDTGEGKSLWAENIVRILHERDLDIAYVLLTHWHGDHTSGVPDLIAHDPAIADRVFKHTPDPGQRSIRDGDIFAVEGANLRAVHTPGHAVDHMCFVLNEDGEAEKGEGNTLALFTGDNVLGHGYSVEEDLGEYVRSLHRMRALGCRRGYPAHGAAIADLPRKMDQYIRHKEMREGQIVDALRQRRWQQQQMGNGSNVASSLTVMELVRELHGELPSDLVEKGLEPFVSQVLKKLAEERRVGFALVRGSRQWFLNEREGKPTAVVVA